MKMGEIKIICDDGEQVFHGTNKLYPGLKEGTAFFYLNHPQRGRIRCYIDEDNRITARKRPFKRGTLFILGDVTYEYGRPVANINQNLDKVYSPTR